MALNKSDLKGIKEIVNNVVIDASHTILEGVQTMFDEHNQENKRDFKNLETKLETKIDNVEKHIKDDIDGLKADLSDTVSRSEFNRLKSRVDKFHPAS